MAGTSTLEALQRYRPACQGRTTDVAQMMGDRGMDLGGPAGITVPSGLRQTRESPLRKPSGRERGRWKKRPQR